MLLGAGWGSLAGMTLDAADAADEASLIEQIADKLDDGVALIGLSYEEDESVLDNKLSAYKTVIARFDAAVVAQEVEAAREMQIRSPPLSCPRRAGIAPEAFAAPPVGPLQAGRLQRAP